MFTVRKSEDRGHQVSDLTFGGGDALQIEDETVLNITIHEPSQLLLFDLI